MKHIEVVAAIIIKDHKVFCARRENRGPLALKWEFPGGKIEIGETKEEALIREIKEELNSNIKIERFFMTVNHKYETFELTMHTYLCSLESEKVELNVHVESIWAKADNIASLDWAEADIPILKELIKII